MIPKISQSLKSFTLSDKLFLSAPQPDFEHNGLTFSNCLLLHKMLITARGSRWWARGTSSTKISSNTLATIKVKGGQRWETADILSFIPLAKSFACFFLNNRIIQKGKCCDTFRKFTYLFTKHFIGPKGKILLHIIWMQWKLWNYVSFYFFKRMCVL